MLIKSRYVILCVDKIALFLNKFSRNTRSGERTMGLPDYGELSKAPLEISRLGQPSGPISSLNEAWFHTLTGVSSTAA